MRTESKRPQSDDQDISAPEAVLIVSSLGTLLVTLVAIAQNF